MDTQAIETAPTTTVSPRETTIVVSRAMQIIRKISSEKEYRVCKYGTYVWSEVSNRFLTINRYSENLYKVVKIKDWPILLHRWIAYKYAPDGHKLLLPEYVVGFHDGDFDNFSYENLYVHKHIAVGIRQIKTKWAAVWGDTIIGTYNERDEAMLMYDRYAKEHGVYWTATNLLLPKW